MKRIFYGLISIAIILLGAFQTVTDFGQKLDAEKVEICFGPFMIIIGGFIGFSIIIPRKRRIFRK